MFVATLLINKTSVKFTTILSLYHTTHIDEVIIDDMPFGFMPGKGTTDSIFIMQ